MHSIVLVSYLLLSRRSFTQKRQSLGNWILFAFLLDPASGSLQRGFAQEIHYRSRNFALELDIASVKDTRAVWFAGMVFTMPVTRHVVKIAALVVIQSPRQAVLFGVVSVIIEGCVLDSSVDKVSKTA